MTTNEPAQVEDTDNTTSDVHPPSDPRSAEKRIQNAEQQLTCGIEQLHGRGGHRAAAEKKLLGAYELLEDAKDILEDGRADEDTEIVTDGGIDQPEDEESDIEPEIPVTSAVGDQMMAWSHGLDEGSIGAIRLTGEFGFLQLHAQEGATETMRARRSIYSAFDAALEEELWMDDDAVEEYYGEVTDETIFQYIADNLDERDFVQNFLVWLSDEMDVEYEPWSTEGF